jgi:predicted DNA-binding transcriptional regulator YafY
MARNRQVVRQWQIVRQIEGRHGKTLRELAEAFGVTTRTIRRDLEALEEAGFPLVDELEERCGALDYPIADARCWRIVDWRKEAA